jgi:hypothetical protein
VQTATFVLHRRHATCQEIALDKNGFFPGCKKGQQTLVRFSAQERGDITERCICCMLREQDRITSKSAAVRNVIASDSCFQEPEVFSSRR